MTTNTFPFNIFSLLVTIIIIICLSLSTIAVAVYDYELNVDPLATTGDEYSAFLQLLRHNVHAGRAFPAEQMVMLGAPMHPPEYLLVELHVEQAEGQVISTVVALNKSNLYVLGYQDSHNGQLRAYFLDDAPPEGKATLFPDAGLRKDNLGFKSSYQGTNSILAKARCSGGDMKVGLGRLGWNVLNLSLMADADLRIQALFILNAAHVISEAIRFKYVEQQMVLNLNAMFTPNYLYRTLVNKWKDISESISNSIDGKNLINPPLNLVREDNSPWSVTTVEEIEPYIAVLAYVRVP